MRQARKNNKWLFWGVWLTIILVYVGVALSHLNDYAGDYDEGVVMQTAVLSWRGFPLYEEVVFNKPPLLIWWLQLFYTLGGATVAVARFASLLLSTLGLVLLGALAAAWWGRWAGPVALLCYLLLPDSLLRANFVTNDLPGMALMLASLLALTIFRNNGRLPFAALAGVCFGLGLGLHPLLVFMIVPLGLILLSTAVRPQQIQWQRLFWAGLAFGGTAVVITLAWLVLVDWQGFVTWVIDYNNAPLDATLTAVAAKNWQKIGAGFQAQIWLLLLSLLSTIWLWRQRPYRFYATLTLIWLGTAVITLSQLQPMWEHYLIFLSYPLVLLAAGGLTTTVRHFKNESKPVKGFAAVLLLLFAVFALSNLAQPRKWSRWTAELEAARATLQRDLEPGSVIISDEPFLIFAAGHLVPPSLADSSSKRIATDFLQVSDVINAILSQPSPAAFWGNGRFQQIPKINTWAEANASRQTQLDTFTLYQFETAQPEHNIRYGRLEPGIQLNGYTVTSQPDEQTLNITLFWQATAPQTEDYKIFVHLLAEDGSLLTQYDADPQQGWLPTSTWQKGVVVPHTAVIPLPAHMPANYSIMAGMYTWPDVVRLPAFTETGARLPHDLIPLTPIR